METRLDGSQALRSWKKRRHQDHKPTVPQLSKCLKFEAVWGVLTDQMI